MGISRLASCGVKANFQSVLYASTWFDFSALCIKIMRKLNHAGILAINTGIHGGYILQKETEQINLTHCAT